MPITDITFCASDCLNSECKRNKANHPQEDNGYCYSRSDFSLTCPDYKNPITTSRGEKHGNTAQTRSKET